MAALIGYVYVRDERGARHRFGPGDDVPSWASKLITNPAAWDSNGGTPEADAAPAPKAKRKSPTRRQQPREGTTQDAPSPAPQGTAQAAADRQAADADAQAAESAPGAGGSE